MAATSQVQLLIKALALSGKRAMASITEYCAGHTQLSIHSRWAACDRSNVHDNASR